MTFSHRVYIKFLYRVTLRSMKSFFLRKNSEIFQKVENDKLNIACMLIFYLQNQKYRIGKYNSNVEKIWCEITSVNLELSNT